MNCSTVYIGIDVHKESFSLCCYTNEKEQAEYPQKSHCPLQQGRQLS